MRLLDVLKMGMFLCDVPTPCMILDHSTALTSRKLSPTLIDEYLNDPVAALDDGSHPLTDLLYIHSSVVSGRESSTAVGQTTLSGVTGDVQRTVLARLDVELEHAGGEEAYVGLGLNNHFTGGYYWGRASGPGAAMPAPGVELKSFDGAQESPTACVVRVANSNDGKRSEWCEFLRSGDQLQLVPAGTPPSMLANLPFEVLVGCRRSGEGVPPGAEPIVDAAWQRVDGVWRRAKLM